MNSFVENEVFLDDFIPVAHKATFSRINGQHLTNQVK